MIYYLTDGTEDCFYTAVFDAYNEKDCRITSEADVQIEVGCELLEVQTDGAKAERVKKKLSRLDGEALNEIGLMLRSCEAARETAAFLYIKLIIARGAPVRAMQSERRVFEATDICNRVTGELHRLKGFLRFMENADGILYAPYAPDNNVTDLLAVHFAKRLGAQEFVIHDLKRNIAALYDGKQIVMTRVNAAEIYLSEHEKYFEGLWKQYYNSVNISSRPHEKQMKGYMPVRYWKFLPEKN